MKLSTAVPLAVVTALLTLMSSGYLLGQSTSSSRANVVTGNDAGLLPAVGDYFSNAGDTPASVEASSSAPRVAQPVAEPKRPAEAAPAAAAVAPAAAAAATVTATAAATTGIGSALPPDYYTGDFLVAQVTPNGDGQYLRTLLKSLMGMAVLLKRTLVLPAVHVRDRGEGMEGVEPRLDGPGLAFLDDESDGQEMVSVGPLPDPCSRHHRRRRRHR